MAHVRKQPTIRSRYAPPVHPEPLPTVHSESFPTPGDDDDDDDEVKKIRLRHPGYPDAENILISLPALDHGGLHHETARVACAVLADFRWNGYLSLTAVAAADPIQDGPDDILTADSYYFHVPDLPTYAVVADFRSCVFPHGRLPPSWLSPALRLPRATRQPRETSYANVVLSRDVSCRVTNATLGTEGAHLVPKSEATWFATNSMAQYCAWEEKGTTDDPRNTILLRSDVHSLFDTKRFLIAPKCDRWVTHALYGPPQEELAQCFHNVHLQPLAGVSVPFLFARFVWTVHALSTFTCGGGTRALLMVKAGDTQRRRLEITGAQFKAELATRSRTSSRTTSPSKRRRDVSEDEDDHVPWDSDDDEEKEQERGRPRKRRMPLGTASPVSLQDYEQVTSVLTSIMDGDGHEETEYSADGTKCLPSEPHPFGCAKPPRGHSPHFI